jgi:hypothetical protein
VIFGRTFAIFDWTFATFDRTFASFNRKFASFEHELRSIAVNRLSPRKLPRAAPHPVRSSRDTSPRN